MFLLHGRRSIDADSDGLHFSSDSSDGHTNWQTYIKYAENDRAFLLFQQGNQIVAPIPKRELAPAQIDELRALFEAHITRK